MTKRALLEFSAVSPWASIVMLAFVAACGGATPPAASPAGAAPDAPASKAEAAPSATPIIAAAAAAPGAGSAGAKGSSSSSAGIPGGGHPVDYDDPTESAGTVTLDTLVAKSAAKSAFPKKTAEDKECWRGMSLTGDHAKDYETLSARCGTPTGLIEYTKPVVGRLHSAHDKRDTYSIKLLGGMCYRYFAVADDSIKDLDILVTKPNGALVADDKTSQPVAIIESEDTWCMPQDATYDFHIEVDGVGTGKYVFAVWARPKG